MGHRSKGQRREDENFYNRNFACQRGRAREQHFGTRMEAEEKFSDGFRGRQSFRGRRGCRSFRRYYGRGHRGRPWGPDRQCPYSFHPSSADWGAATLGSADLRWRLAERPAAQHDDGRDFISHEALKAHRRQPQRELHLAPPPGRDSRRSLRRRSPSLHHRSMVPRRRRRSVSLVSAPKQRKRSYERENDLQTYDDVDKNDDDSPEYQRYWDSFIFGKQIRPQRTVESRVVVESPRKPSNERNASQPESTEKRKRSKHENCDSPDELRHPRSSKRRISKSSPRASDNYNDSSSSWSSDSSSSSSSDSSSSGSTSDSSSNSKNKRCSPAAEDQRRHSRHHNRTSPPRHKPPQMSSTTDLSVYESSHNASVTKTQSRNNSSTSNIPVVLSNSYGSKSSFNSSSSWFDSSCTSTTTTSNESTVYTSEDSGNASMADVSLERSDPRGYALEQLRKLTRWVLRSCISRYMPSVRPPQLSALQLGLSRDLDMSKWTECGVQHVFMVDREGSHMDAAGRAYQRAREAGSWCTVEWICKDFTREVWPHAAVDVAFSHLAMHAALGSSSKAEIFAHNISCSLKEGSCLVVTVISATRLLSLLRKGRDGKVFEGKNFRLKLHGHSARSTLPRFGVRFTLQIGTDRFEDYVVQLSVVEDIFAPHRLQLIIRRSFMQLFDQSCSFNTCLEQLQHLQLVGHNAPTREKLSPIMQDIAELFDVVIFRKISPCVQ